MKKYFTFIISFVLMALTPAIASANPVPFIQQGDKVLIENGPGNIAVCTIGYVDEHRRNFMFTGHCSGGRVGSKVMNDRYQEIGRVEVNYYRGTVWSDIAVVNVTNGNIGGNIHSGNTWVQPHTVRRGETLCSYGANSGAVHCGRVTGRDLPNAIIGSRNSGGIGGDSGGPAWIPGRGLVGFYSGFTDDSAIFTYPDNNYGKIYIPTIDDIRRDINTNINNGIREINKYTPENVKVPLSSF